MLFWNESERQEGDWEHVEGQPQRVVTVGYGLIPHFITHERAPIDFSTIDSRASRFGSAVTIRDPETGSMVRQIKTSSRRTSADEHRSKRTTISRRKGCGCQDWLAACFEPGRVSVAVLFLWSAKLYRLRMQDHLYTINENVVPEVRSCFTGGSVT